MRVVHLNPFYFPYAGGIERRIESVGRRLVAHGHEVHIVTAALPGSQPGTTEEKGGLTVHRLPSKFPLSRFYNPPPVATAGLVEAIRAIGPDVVDYHFRWSPSYNKAFRRLDCPRVITYHNTYGEGKGLLGLASRLNDRLYMRTLRHAQAVVCVSDRVRRDLTTHGATVPMRVNYNSVEVAEIEAITGAPETRLERPFAVAVGRMVAVKGFDVLVDAWSQVEGIDLVLAGKGPELEALKERAQKRGVADRVHFTGWCSEEEKVRLLKAAVAYVHPARFESFPFSILEAMAAGAPLVTSNVGGIPEAVGEASPQLGHDPAEWAREVNRLVADPRLRLQRAAASRRRLELFDWNRITRDLAGIYDEARAAMRR